MTRPEQIRPLAALAKLLFAKVNLIPYNQVEGLPWERPGEEICEAFLPRSKNKKSPPRCAAKKDTISTPPADSCG